MRSQLRKPALKLAVVANNQLLFEDKYVISPLSNRSNMLMEDLELSRGYVKPSFSYGLLGFKTPTYKMKLTEVNTALAEFPKQTTPADIYKDSFRELRLREYAPHFPKDTD